MNMRIPSILLALFALSALAACDVDTTETRSTAIPDTVFAAIDSTIIRQHVATLSSDEFEGRGTGTRGEELTINYVLEHMQRVGLQGGMPDGSFFQEVPLLGLTPTDIGRPTLTPEDGAPVSPSLIDEFIGPTDHATTHAWSDGDLEPGQS